MPTVYTGKARGLLALGYYKGKENKRREMVSENQTKSSNAYNSAMSAYNAYQTSKQNRLAKKKGVNTETGDYSGDTGNYSANDTDGDGLNEYFSSDLKDSSVESTTKKKKGY